MGFQYKQISIEERYLDLRIGGLGITPSPISEVRDDEQPIRVREHGR